MVPKQHYPLPLVVAERAMFEFRHLWLKGLQPQLYLETSPDGKICVNARVIAQYSSPDVPNPLFNPEPHNYKARRKSPSQIRRQKRRALARAVVHGPNRVQADAAVQAVHGAADKAAQTVPVQTNSSSLAVQEKLCCDDVYENDYQADLPSLASVMPQPNQEQPPEAYDCQHIQELQKQKLNRPQHQPVDVRTDKLVNETRTIQNFKYLEDQKRMKELQLQQLSAKINLGFKPLKTRKPF